MNRFTFTIFLVCLFAVPVVQAADEEDHAAHHPSADQSQATPAQDDKAAGMKMMQHEGAEQEMERGR